MELNDKQLRRLNDGREYRAMTMTVRAAEDESEMIVEGYATTFNQPYMLYDGRDYKIVEQVAPNAFEECDMSDVIMQYDHEGRVFARNRNGTLTLAVDAIGLKITANLGGTDIGRQLYQEIKGGYTDKMSFGFVVAEDQRSVVVDHEKDVETVTRTITKIKKLYDVSAVSIPANDMTSISARRYADGVIDGIANHVQIELYTQLKDPTAEGKVEAALSSLYWEKETNNLDAEKCYQTIYEIEV